MKGLLALPKEKLQKIILVAIVSLTAIGVAGYFTIVTPLATLTTKRTQIATLTPKVQAAEQNLKQEVKSGDLRDQLKQFVETQQAKMITGDPFSWVVRELSLLGEKHPVHILGMRPGSATPSLQKSRYETFVAHLEVEGTYDQLGTFVRDLENAFPTGSVRSLQFTPGDTARAQCRAVLEMALSVLPADEPAKPGAKPTTERTKTL